MKRLLVIFLTLLLLGCLPTPEQAFVVSKSDNVLEQKLNATPKPAEETVAVSTDEPRESVPEPVNEPTEAPLKAQFFPERWDEDAENIREYVTFAIHADVEAKADGLYPVYKTRPEPITEEQVIALANKLLTKPEERELVDTMTKDEWTSAFKSFLDEVAAWEEWERKGRPDDGVDRDETGYDPEFIEQESQWYMEQIQNAPDKLDKAPVSDYSGYRLGENVRYTLEDGSVAQIGSTAFRPDRDFNVVSISKGCRHHPNVYKESQYKSDKHMSDALSKKSVKIWQQTTLSRGDAEAIAYREIERLGFSGFSIAYGQPANLYDSTENGTSYVASGWSFTLRRDYDGYPLVDRFHYESSSLLEFGSGDGFVYNKPISEEGISLFVDETGIWFFGYSAQKAIVGKPNANVELLPFAEIVRIVRNTLTACYPSLRYQGNENLSFDLEVYRMILTPYTLRVKDSDDFYEVPCWVVFFDGWHKTSSRERREENRTDPNATLQSIIINAVDGTVVHNRAGY